MTYLLMLHFSLTIAMLPYPSLEECETEAVYYRDHYGKELTEADCVKIDEEDFKDE